MCPHCQGLGTGLRTAGGEEFGDRQTGGAGSEGYCHLTAGQMGLVAPGDSRAGGGIQMMSGPQLSPQGQQDSPRLPAHLAANTGHSPPPVLPRAPAPPAHQPRPSWSRQGCDHLGGTTRAQTLSPGQGFAQRAPLGCPLQRGPATIHKPQPQVEPAPGEAAGGRVPDHAGPQPRRRRGSLAPRGPDTPPAEPSRGLGLSLFSSPARQCQPHCRTPAGSPSAAMERAPNLVGDCRAAQGSLLVFLL